MACWLSQVGVEIGLDTSPGCIIILAREGDQAQLQSIRLSQASRGLEPVHNVQVEDSRPSRQGDVQTESPSPVISDLNVVTGLRQQARQSAGAVYVVIDHQNEHYRPDRTNLAKELFDQQKVCLPKLDGGPLLSFVENANALEPDHDHIETFGLHPG